MRGDYDAYSASEYYLFNPLSDVNSKPSDLIYYKEFPAPEFIAVI